jgi:hypothetical protein
VQSSCSPLIEDYTEIFHMIMEGDIPSIQCKMSFRGPKCVRKVDGLSPGSSPGTIPESWKTTKYVGHNNRDSNRVPSEYKSMGDGPKPAS